MKATEVYTNEKSFVSTDTLKNLFLNHLEEGDSRTPVSKVCISKKRTSSKTLTFHMTPKNK